MGIHDRPYFREESSYSAGFGRPGGGGGFSFGMPKAGQAVKRLLIINIVVFVAQQFLDRHGEMSAFLGVTSAAWPQVWRYITFQFLHANFWHIALNMLGLYMLGTPLEQYMGQRRFVWFYLSCGVVAGIAYAAMGLALGSAKLPPDMPIVGASGGVYAIVLACAVRFPQFKLIFFLFPVPIRTAAVIIFGGMALLILSTLTGGQATGAFWSQVAHLGGAVGAAFWIWGLPKLMGLSADVRHKASQGAWDKKLHRQADEQKTINEILKKVHDQGINSLTRKEKNTLADATRKQREQGG